MTIQCVISFFESGDKGYLLASDSRLSTKCNGCIEDDFLGEKAFLGNNFTGLFGGSIKAKKDEDPEKFHTEYMSSLDDIFCDIKENKDYSHIPQLKQANFYRLFIAKKESDNLQLFKICSVGNSKHKACKLHELKDQTELSKVWFSGFTPNSFMFKPDFIFSLDEATEVAKSLLSAEVDFCTNRKYDPGPTHLYVVSFGKLERLPI